MPWGQLDAVLLADRSDLVLETPRTDVELVVEIRDTFSGGSVDGVDHNMGPGRFSVDSFDWRSQVATRGYYAHSDGLYTILDVVVADRGLGTVGVLPVAIKLAFANSEEDLLSEMDGRGTPRQIDGELPTEFRDDQVGTLTIVDVRGLGTSLNQMPRHTEPVDCD